MPMISDAVLFYDLAKFCALTTANDNAVPPPQTLEQITHLYFRKQSFKLSPQEQIEFCNALQHCLSLTSINLSYNHFLNWDDIFNALAALPNLKVVNIKGTEIDSKSVKNKFAGRNVNIIDDKSVPYASRESFKLRDLWTEYELQERLLVAHAAHIENPTIFKFSRKRFSDIGDISALIKNGKPFLLLPTSSISPDVDEYNNRNVEDNLRIGLVVHFAANSDDLIPSLAKIQPKDCTIEACFHQEIHTLQQEQEAYGIERPLKTYVIQSFLKGNNLYTQIVNDHKQGKHLTPTVKIQRGMATVLAILMLHARRKIHLDIKPLNLMLLANPSTNSKKNVNAPLVTLIDLESVQSCDANGFLIQRRGSIYTTHGYRPPEASNGETVRYSRDYDAFSAGRTLLIILSGRPFKYKKEFFFDAPSDSQLYEDVIEHHKHEIATFDRELAEHISGMLNPDYTLRTTIDKTYYFLAQKYPEEMQNVLQAKYRHEIALLKNSIKKCPNGFENSIFFSTKKNDPRTNKLAQFMTWSKPIDEIIILSDVIFVNILRHVVQIYIQSRGQPTEKMRVNIQTIIDELAQIEELNSSNCTQIYHALEQENIFITECIHFISTQILKMRANFFKNYVLQNDVPIIEHLGNLHINVLALISNNAPIQDVFSFTTAALDQIQSNSLGSNVNMEIINKITELRDSLQQKLNQLGKPTNSELKSSKNPLLKASPKQIIDLTKVYSFAEVKFLLRDTLINDANDSAKLGKFMFAYGADKATTNALLKSGAKNIYWAIMHGRDDLVLEYLQSGYDPCLIEDDRNESPLDYAFARAKTDKGRIIFSSMLKSVHENDLYVLKRYMETSLAADNRKDNYATIAILLHAMRIKPASFEQYLGEKLLSFFQLNQDNLIIFFAQCGIDPLMSLNTEPYVERSLNPFTCFTEKPYLSFPPDCIQNSIALAMQKGKEDLVINLLPYINHDAESHKQLGFHLVVAARDNKPNLAKALSAAGANTECQYPVGRYSGKTAYQFAAMYNFILNYPDYPPAANAQQMQQSPQFLV